MNNESNLFIKVEGTFGSDFQEESFYKSLGVMTGALQDFYNKQHKKNQITIHIYDGQAT